MVGATLPVMVGFVSPVPGPTALGALVSPFGALVGGAYGVFTAAPDEDVEHAEVMLAIAADNLRQIRLRDSFHNRLVDLGNARTDLKFAYWPAAHAASDVLGRDQPANPSFDCIVARLQVWVERAGLRGMYSVDPHQALANPLLLACTRSTHRW